MPFVMKHASTGTLLACVQRNGYRLAYYGIKLWEEYPSSELMLEALVEAGIDPEEAAGSIEDWEGLNLTDHEVKMANVKLRNDPLRVVAYRNGHLLADSVKVQ